MAKPRYDLAAQVAALGADSLLPLGRKETARESMVVDGTRFVRIHGDKWLSESGQIEVRRPSGRETYVAVIDLEVVRGRFDKWKRFRSLEGAMRAGIKAGRIR